MLNKIIGEDVKDASKYLNSQLPDLENKKILITGAGGMLASYIVYTLLYLNQHKLKKPVKLFLVIRGGKQPFGQNENIFYLNLDIAKEVPKVKEVDYIIHAASKAAPKLYIKDRIDTLNTNILGLYNVLAMENKRLKGLLYFSSCDVYGDPQTEMPVDELFIGKVNHLSKRSCYAEGKRICETICMNYFWQKKTPVKIARISHTFGPGMNLQEGRVFSDFIKYGLEGRHITIDGDPNKKRAMLYVKDAAIMFLKIVLSDKNGQVYNVSNDKNFVSIEEFGSLICNSFNKYYKKKIKLIKKFDKNKDEYFKGAVGAILPSIKKFTKDFKYIPSTKIKEAVSRTVDYYLLEGKKI